MTKYAEKLAGLDELTPKGEVVKALRKLKGWSQEVLASKCDTSQKQISKVERAAGKVDALLMLRLAELFDKNLDDVAVVSRAVITTTAADEESQRRIQRAKLLILNGIMHTLSIPVMREGKYVDLRRFVEDEWEHEDFHQLRLTKHEKKLVWQGLIDTGHCQSASAKAIHFCQIPNSAAAILNTLATTYVFQIVELLHGTTPPEKAEQINTAVQNLLKKAESCIWSHPLFFHHLTTALITLQDDHGYLTGITLNFLNTWTGNDERCMAINLEESAVAQQKLYYTRQLILRIVSKASEDMLQSKLLDESAYNSFIEKTSDEIRAINQKLLSLSSEGEKQFFSNSVAFLSPAIADVGLPAPDAEVEPSKSKLNLILRDQFGDALHFKFGD